MNFTRPIILASNSPRRQQLLHNCGLSFTIRVKNTPEDFPDDIPLAEVPQFLARKKAMAFTGELGNEVVITADTVVIIDDQILNKPVDEADARRMLRLLSGRQHEVITGVCLHSLEKTEVFADRAAVFFKSLSESDITYYITHYRPFDKAGAYGAQDWLGMVGIERIEGSYFTVMGLPTHRVYEALQLFM